MTVYIEYVAVNNFVIDYFLLSAAFTVTGKRDRALKRVLAALCGAVFALIYPLIYNAGAFSFALKIAAGLTVVFAAASYSSVKDYYVNAAVFFALTFAVGGGVTGVFSIFNIEYGEFTVAFCAIPAYAFIKIIKAVISFSFKRAGESGNIYDCEIVYGGNTVKVKGFMDTGNALYDGDIPVVVCDKKTALKIMGETFPKMKKLRVLTVAGKSEVFAFGMAQIKIFISSEANIFSNVTVAVAKNVGQGYDVILHPALKEKGNERSVAS